MHPRTQEDAALGQGPSVAMTKEEAIQLFVALKRARNRLALSAARANPETSNSLFVMRADLKALDEFITAHCEAHGIGGH